MSSKQILQRCDQVISILICLAFNIGYYCLSFTSLLKYLRPLNQH
ncbi:hypothetical protein [Candidatus Hodgkinia cicadicola]